MDAREERWLAAITWREVVSEVRSKRRARKLRLFGCACCRRIETLVTDERSRAALRAGEAFADDEIGKDALITARKAAATAANEIQKRVGLRSTFWAAFVAEMVTHVAFDAFESASIRAADAVARSGLRTQEQEEQSQLVLLRDIFGNPFQPVEFDPSWSTEAVVDLARGMYESRDFGPMPVLADALEDAGCADAEVLGHCRGPGPHVRGCWVVDLVLGKA